MKPWKLQKLAGDVIWDLRNRGLLPIAALLVVAIVVVPVMISRGGKKPVGANSAEAAISAPEATSAVVAYDPGVRNYEKRLDKLVKKDPFKQHFQTPTGASLSSTLPTTVTSTGTGSSSTITGSDGGGGTGGGGGGGGGGGDSKTVVKTKYVSYRMDVAFGEVGFQKRINDLEQLSFLASEETPVIVFLGIGDNGSKGLFLVSSDVSSVTGDGACIPSSTSACEILAMHPGEVEDFAYTPDGKTYRLKLITITRSTTG
jgi:hypothetical protein